MQVPVKCSSWFVYVVSFICGWAIGWFATSLYLAFP